MRHLSRAVDAESASCSIASKGGSWVSVTETTQSRRTMLYDEHVALGAAMTDYQWAGMAMPWSYRTSLAQEQRAVREQAGLADVSQLRVVKVAGAGAVACLERLLPRRVDDMAVGTSRFSVVLSRFGRICDEAIVLRIDADEVWISHGCGATRAQLARLVEAGEVSDVAIAHLDDVHALSLQGPASLQVLAALASTAAVLESLPFLAHRRIMVAGASVLVARSGFTGELGFELFCAGADVVVLWRALIEAGTPLGLVPYSYRCVDLLRIEAGFTLYPVDLAVAASLWDANLGWQVRDKRADYVGKEAVARARAVVAPKRSFAGLRLPGDHTIARGATVQRAERVIGVVTSSAWSPASNETLCIVHVDEAERAGEAAASVAEATGQLVRLPFRERRGGTGPSPVAPPATEPTS